VHTTSDIWTVGVILAFLLQTPQERSERPLFSGSTPLEVLRSIARTVQSPDLSDLETMKTGFNMDTRARALLDAIELPTLKPNPDELLTRKCSRAPPEALNLLGQLLVFNPLSRLSSRQALQHRFFSPYVTTVSASHYGHPSNL